MGKKLLTSIYNLMVFTFAHVLFNWGINNLQPFNLNCKSNAVNNILIMLCQHCRCMSICACTCLCVCDFDCLNLVVQRAAVLLSSLGVCILYRWTVMLMLRSAVSAQKKYISQKYTIYLRWPQLDLIFLKTTWTPKSPYLKFWDH